MIARHASYSARIELKPPPQVPDGLPASKYSAAWLKVLVRRYVIRSRHEFTNIRIHTRLPFVECDVPSGVTQARMPQGKTVNRHAAVLVVATFRDNWRYATLKIIHVFGRESRRHFVLIL